MLNSEEEGFIDAVQKGNPAPFTFLVDTYKYMAYTIALRILRNPEDAEDAAQESFIKAFQQIRQFEGKSKFSTWLYTIVYRTSISKLKEKKVTMLSIDQASEENHSRDYAMPQIDEVGADDEKQFIKQAIQKLPEPESLLVTLFYIGENSIKEIQSITGLSQATIKIRLFRARKKLERELRFLIDHHVRV
jgi:RNA polymerase sigma factor (sigma-70 family)